MASANKNNNIILRVEGLKKYFPVRRGFFQKIAGWNKAVDGVSFKIQEGKTLGLVGESGCGKTTAARTILRALIPTDGQVLFRSNGERVDLAALPERRLKHNPC